MYSVLSEFSRYTSRELEQRADEVTADKEGSIPSAMQADLGSVVSLWRYPVKSMMGEELNSSQVTDIGLLGDRGYAVVKTTHRLGWQPS